MEYCTIKMALDVTSKSPFVKHVDMSQFFSEVGERIRSQLGYFSHASHPFSQGRIIGSFCNDDGDGNKNGKKAIGLDKQ